MIKKGVIPDNIKAEIEKHRYAVVDGQNINNHLVAQEIEFNKDALETEKGRKIIGWMILSGGDVWYDKPLVTGMNTLDEKNKFNVGGTFDGGDKGVLIVNPTGFEFVDTKNIISRIINVGDYSHINCVRPVFDAGGEGGHPDVYMKEYSYYYTAAWVELGEKMPLDNSETYKRFIEAGTDVNGMDGWLLRVSAQEGYEDVARLAIKYGADVNIDYKGNTPLLDASKNGHVKIAMMLIEAGADINVSDGLVMLNALKSGSREMVELLMNVRKFNIRDFSWYGAMELLAIRLNAGLGKIKSK